MTIDLTLDESIILDVDDGFAETVSFTPSGGAARDLDVKWFDGFLDADPYSEPTEHRGAMMLAAAADVTDLVHKSSVVRSTVTYLTLSPSDSEVSNMPFILIKLQKQ